MTIMTRQTWNLFVLLMAAIFIAGCNKAETEPEPLVAVQVAKVAAKPLTQRIVADAVLSPVRQAAIVPKVNSPVKNFLVQRGDRVKKGQLLATLENSDIAAALTENRGGYEQAEATFASSTQAGIPEESQKAELEVKQTKENLDAQSKLLESRKSLFEQGAIPRKDLDVAQVSYVQAKAQYEIAQRHLESLNAVGRGSSIKAANAQLTQARGKFEGAKAQLGYTEIRSPIDGFVTDRPSFSGEMPAAGTPLITVMDTSSVIAKAHISQTEATQLKLNDGASIIAPALEEPIPGKVTQISPALDPNSTTVEIWVTATNRNQQLRPGSAVKVQIDAKEVKDALAVPANAIVRDDSGKSNVYVVSDGVATIREVTLGVTDATAGLIQVTSGLKAGETVVTNQAYGLPDKTKVTIQETETGAQAKSKESKAKDDKD
jgi:HlyD family secretion protein